MKQLAAVLRNRNLALLLSGQLVSTAGDWLYAVVLSVAIYGYTGHNTIYVSLLWLARFVPALVLGPFSGTVAYRIGYRRAMMLADLSRMLLVLVLVFTLSSTTWAILIPVSLLMTTFGSLYAPAGTALVPRLVRDQEQRMAAYAVLMEVVSLAAIMGSALGGIFSGHGWITATLLAQAASFGVSALSLLLLRIEPPASTPTPATQPETTGKESWLSRMRFLVGRPVLVFAAVAMALPELCSGAATVWIVPLGERSLHLGHGGAGYLYSALAIGALIGSLVAASLGGSIRLDTLLALSVVVTGISYFLIGAVPAAVVALLCLVLVGISEAIEFTAYETLQQQAIPENLLAHAAGTMGSFFLAMMVLGNVIGGVTAQVFGVNASISVAGVLVVVFAVGGWWNLRRQSEHQPDSALLSHIPAFAAVPSEIREWAVRRMTREEFENGAVIVREGDEGDKLYVLAEGAARVEVALESHRERQKLTAGDYFGEIALLHRVPRTATVTAVGTVVVYALSREDFEDLQNRATVFRDSLLETATARLDHDTNLKLALATRS